jgi:hypothetical protein
MKTPCGQMSRGKAPGGSVQRVDPVSKSKDRLNRQAIETEGRWCLNTHQRPWRTSVTIISPFAQPSNQISPITSKAGRKQTGDISENDEGGAAARKFSTGCSTASGGI